MQAAPAVTVSVGRSGVTMVAYAVLGCLATACCALWALQRADLPGALLLGAVVGFVVLSLGAWVREPARRLRWDGQVWWLDLANSQAPATSGDVVVAMDLDVWLLLRFRGEASAGRPRNHWLALQRSDHAVDWHALRCALYSPRPTAPGPMRGLSGEG